eukprot:g8077.t1
MRSRAALTALAQLAHLCAVLALIDHAATPTADSADEYSISVVTHRYQQGAFPYLRDGLQNRQPTADDCHKQCLQEPECNYGTYVPHRGFAGHAGSNGECWLSSTTHAYNAECGYGPMPLWDTSRVTDMEGLFSNRQDFNEPIGFWDTGKVTTMEHMFYNAKAFNQPIGAWDTGEVTTMQGMFMYADSFNQPIGAWHTGEVTNMA